MAEVNERELEKQMLASLGRLEERETEYARQKRAYDEATANYSSVMDGYLSDVTAFKSDIEQAKALPYYDEIAAVFFKLTNQTSENQKDIQ